MISAPCGAIAGITTPAEDEGVSRPVGPTAIVAVGPTGVVLRRDDLSHNRRHAFPETDRPNCCNADGSAARLFHQDAVFGSICSQMLVLRVSGMMKTASTKHTAGTTIG